MSAKIIDGRAVAARTRAEVATAVEEFAAATGRTPGLATVMVGEDPASAIYVANKQKACREVGMAAFDRRLPASATEAEIADELHALNADDAVSGVLLQLPLPEGRDGRELSALVSAEKDVDGLTPVNVGLLSLGRPGLRPCTPVGIMELLREAGVTLEGAQAVVVGRSNLIGKPMTQLLLEANATVTTCHSRTRDLQDVCAGAEVLVVAAGRPRMVGAGFVAQGAAVIDVGMHRLTPEEAGNKSGLVGDVDFAAVSEVASAITPVPGGVGPMTVAMLLRNTLEAARMQLERSAPAGTAAGTVR